MSDLKHLPNPVTVQISRKEARKFMRRLHRVSEEYRHAKSVFELLAYNADYGTRDGRQTAAVCEMAIKHFDRIEKGHGQKLHQVGNFFARVLLNNRDINDADH